MQLKYNQEEFQQLIASSSAYMSKIQAYSNALSDCPFEQQLLCLQHCLNILEDQSIPIIKKLFVFRFIKDTLILASLSFYECVVIKIFPWLARFSVCLRSVVEDSKVAEAGKILRGSKPLPVAEISVCKNLISLIQDILKWMGTHIQNHPYSPIKFKSAFRLLLEKYPQVTAKKLNQLTFFKPEDVNRYQAHYLEKETSDSEGERLAEYIKHELELVEKLGRSDTLLLLLQTGDEFVISCLIEEIQTKFEEVSKEKAETGIQTLQAISQLFLLGEMHFCNEVKQELLCSILVFALMLQKMKVKHKEQPAVSRVMFYLKKWQEKCVQMKIPSESIKLAIKRLNQQGVQSLKKQQGQASGRLVLNLITDINKDKLPYIDFNQTQLLLKLAHSQYIPLQGSDHVLEKQNVSKNSMDEPSHSSIKSYNKKSNFLEAYSKVPPSHPITPKKNNTSEVKQIYFQHSNLSQRFHQFQQSTPEDSNANHLLMSFKVSSPHFADHSRSPQVMFSDSFTSNQKNPTKQSKKYEENIHIIHEPSHTIQNSSTSKPAQKSQIISQKHVFNSSYDKEVQDLKQQSNKRNTSKMSEVSDYYKEEIKQSADFAQRQPIQNKRDHINEYMLPNEYSQVDSVRRSKHSDQKQPNSIYQVKSVEKKLRKSRSKKEGSLSSRGEKSKSIKVIYFNQAQKQGQQGYQLRTAQQRKIQVEVIRVEKTVLKPKFGFKCQEQQTINTETVQEESIAKEMNFTNKEQSISFYPSISADNPPNFEQIPQNFKDILACNKEKVKLNQFNHKTRELQIKIQKMKERKARIQKEVKLKSVEIQKIKEQLPVPLNVLENQNKSLLKALKIKKQKSFEIMYEKTDLKFPILHISGAPLKEEIKKQILYLKSKLYHDEILEIGMQVKNKELSLYFTFFKSVEECAIKVEENSLKLSQRIDAKMYMVLQGKQIKFKSKIQNYTLFDNCFEMAKLRVDIKLGKNSKTQLLALPYHLYNQLQFQSPSHHFHSNKSTDWHFSCASLRESHQYLQDFLPKGKFLEGKYRVGIELKNQRFDYQIVVEGQKFAIKYEDRLQKEQFPILNTLISLFQVGRVVS